jgi:hypothetical protein
MCHHYILNMNIMTKDKEKYICVERVRTAKEEMHYFPKESNQPAMVEQPIRL